MNCSCVPISWLGPASIWEQHICQLTEHRPGGPWPPPHQSIWDSYTTWCMPHSQDAQADFSPWSPLTMRQICSHC